MNFLTKKNLISILFVITFAAYSANTHLGDGVYLLDEKLDPTGSVVKVSVSAEQVENLLSKTFIYDDDKRVLAFEKELWNITKNKVYSKFSDDFDYIYFVLNSTTIGQLGFTGRFIPVRIDYENTDLYTRKGNTEDYAEWGSDSKLKGVFYLPRYDAIKDGPSLHEFAHQWGVYICDELSGHWGASSAGGQLGGFKYLKELGNNQYQGSMTGSWTDGFGTM